MPRTADTRQVRSQLNHARASFCPKVGASASLRRRTRGGEASLHNPGGNRAGEIRQPSLQDPRRRSFLDKHTLASREHKSISRRPRRQRIPAARVSAVSCYRWRVCARATGLSAPMEAAPVAHESVLKEAETNATKRALATFGSQFGLALYDKERNGMRRRNGTGWRSRSYGPCSRRPVPWSAAMTCPRSSAARSGSS